MESKITPMFIYCLSLGIALLATCSPIKAQQTDTTVSISSESISTAEELSAQGQAKAEILDYKGAIADLSQAILLNPEEAEFYYQRGLILSKLSDKKSALQDFDDAIARDPNHAGAYLQRGGMSFELVSSLQITNYQGSNYQLNRLPGNFRGDGRAVLDLKRARNLFELQGDQEGYQTADRLIKHFLGESE
ncbi:MAG: tetratricopeptide repeat protein [Cyanobacteria bacterium J06600_6]